MRAGRWVFALATATLVGGCGGGDYEPTSVAAVTSASPLGLSIAEPASGARTSGSRVLVAGVLSVPAERVVVNGSTACIVGNRFFLNDLELAGGAASISAVASSPSGAASATVRVNRAARSVALRVSGDACGRPVPYEASFTLGSEGFSPGSVIKVEADFDGDGTVDFRSSTFAEQMSYTYKTPGVLRARFTVFLADGTRLDTWRYQTALTMADATAPLAATVDGLSSAFKAQDIGKALSYFTAEAKARYGWTLIAFKDQLPEVAAAIANARPSSIGEQHAEYKISVTHGADTIVYNIVLIDDGSGHWKLDSL